MNSASPYLTEKYAHHLHLLRTAHHDIPQSPLFASRKPPSYRSPVRVRHKSQGSCHSDEGLRVPDGGMRPDKSPMLNRSPRGSRSPSVSKRISPNLGTSPNKGTFGPLFYKPRPRSIATDHGYNRPYQDSVPLSPEYDYRSSTSNLVYSQPGLRDADHDVRKWGSCSRLEYNTQPQHYPLSHERTDGDGGPTSYNTTEPHNLPYNAYRRHSSSKVSSHSSGHSDDVLLQHKAELEEKNRVIESLKMRVSEQDVRLSERALSDKSGEHGAIAESLDSGIDIRSDSGVMKPLFPNSSSSQRIQNSQDRALQDQRNEISRLKLHIQRLDNRHDNGVSADDEQSEKLQHQIANLIKENHALSEEKASINRKFSRLQDYLTTLPTVHEYNDLKERLSHLSDDNRKLQEDSKKTTDSSKDAKQKEIDLKKYQKKCIEYKDTIAKLEKQNNILKSQNATQAKQELQKIEQEKNKMDKKLEQLRKEVSLLTDQKESAKNLVGGYYEKFNNAHEKNKILSQSLNKSADEVKILMDQLELKEERIVLLTGKVELLSSDLGQSESRLEEFGDKKLVDPKDVEFMNALLCEFNGAIKDMNCVVEVCQMYVNGQQPDINLLLNLGFSPSLEESLDFSFEEKLKDVREIRSQIEYLRTYLAEIYAVEVGRQCPTQ